MGQICKSPRFFFESKQKTNSEEKEKIKATRSQKQNWKQIFYKIKRIIESWKLFTKSKLQYFPKYHWSRKAYKKTQASRRKGESFIGFS